MNPVLAVALCCGAITADALTVPQPDEAAVGSMMNRVQDHTESEPLEAPPPHIVSSADETRMAQEHKFFNSIVAQERDLGAAARGDMPTFNEFDYTSDPPAEVEQVNHARIVPLASPKPKPLVLPEMPNPSSEDREDISWPMETQPPTEEEQIMMGQKMNKPARLATAEASGETVGNLLLSSQMDPTQNDPAAAAPAAAVAAAAPPNGPLAVSDLKDTAGPPWKAAEPRMEPRNDQGPVDIVPVMNSMDEGVAAAGEESDPNPTRSEYFAPAVHEQVALLHSLPLMGVPGKGTLHDQADSVKTNPMLPRKIMAFEDPEDTAPVSE